MNTLPFAQNLLLWRLARGLSQAHVARKARIPQPNLSDLERGKRDVSLRTLRALAMALEIQPGLLADGVPPPRMAATVSTRRNALERIAAAVVDPAVTVSQAEREVVRLLRPLVWQRLRKTKSLRVLGPPGPRRTRLAWLELRARCPRPMIESLIQRITERAGRG